MGLNYDGGMRREQVSAGRKQLSYLVTETPSGGARQEPLRNIVFLHAFPLNAEMWRPQGGALPQGWRMIAPDYRGFGPAGSLPAGAEQTRMNDLAGDVIDLLDTLEITSAVVAGCSMGGYVAFEVIASAAGYVSGLVLIDTRAGADTDEGKAGRRKMLETIEKSGSEAIADEMTPKLLGVTTQRDRPDLVRDVHQMIRSAHPDAIKLAVLAMMNRKDMTGMLAGIKIPTLVIAGAEDTLIPLAAIQQMHGAIKGAKFETIAAAGHLPNLEQGPAFDAVLRTFLQQF
jgi:3-oxoadipate enol-lactonase